jgi:hypothetical protein
MANSNTPIKQVTAPKKRGPAKGTYYKQTPDVLEKLRQAFAIDATIDEACFYAGIDQSTYHIWKKKEPKQFEHLEALRNTPILAARQTLATAVKSDPAMALKYLERKRRAEFATRVEETGADGAPLMPVSLDSSILNRLTSSAPASSSSKQNSGK